MKKLIFLAIFVILFTVLGGCTNGAGGEEDTSNYPDQPIELIIPYDAGGGTDIIARSIASVVSEHLPNNQAMEVVNQPGATGSVGAAEVFNSPSDGYKIGVFTNSALTIQPHVSQTEYSHDSFEAISRVTIHPQVLFVNKDSEFDSLEELIDYAENNPEELSIGTSGAGGTAHLSAEAFMNGADISLKTVHFDGGNPALTNLMGGHVDAVVVPPTSATSEVKALAVIGENRSQTFEDVPTTKELGIDESVETFVGFYAPEDTPSEIIEILDEAINNALEEDEVQQQITNLGVESGYLGPEELQEATTESFNVSEELLNQAGLIE